MVSQRYIKRCFIFFEYLNENQQKKHFYDRDNRDETYVAYQYVSSNREIKRTNSYK